MDVLFWSQEVRRAQRKVAARRCTVVAMALMMMVGAWSLVGPANLKAIGTGFRLPSEFAVISTPDSVTLEL